MISICIPVYNFDIRPLIQELTRQVNELNQPIEIIVIDDGSNQFKRENKEACKKHQYLELDHNIGRARIRNLFLDYAHYPYLLFLDCDSLIPSRDFLKTYLLEVSLGTKVICGGRIFRPLKPARNKRLRWLYGTKREGRSLFSRNQNPYKSFMTNNVLINKDVLSSHPFDERLTRYGHEDTLFGLVLNQNKIPIQHINNPVLNGDQELNSNYLQKTDDGVFNLVQLLEYTDNDLVINHVRLLEFYNNLGWTTSIVKAIFILSKPIIKFLLKNGYANLYLFDFYKLGLLIDHLDKADRYSDKA